MYLPPPTPTPLAGGGPLHTTADVMGKPDLSITNGGGLCPNSKFRGKFCRYEKPVEVRLLKSDVIGKYFDGGGMKQGDKIIYRTVSIWMDLILVFLTMINVCDDWK